MHVTRGHSSYLRRQQIKNLLRSSLKFAITVFTAAVVANWLQPWMIQVIPRSPSDLVKSSKRRMRDAVASVASPSDREEWQGELNEFYSKYLDEVLRSLRSDRNVRLARLDVPQNILSYQRNLAAQEKGGAALRIQARSPKVPMIAVSRSSKSFLEEMRVTYVDPKALPQSLVRTASLSPSILENFLLIPDFSGSNSRKYGFGRK